jgi:DNA polymerase elongation subunit (family B)
MDMIQVLAKARNSKEFVDRIPEALKILRDYAKRLIEGKVSTRELLIAKRLSKNPSSYTHGVLNSIAAKQLVREGVEISAGQTIQYLITRCNGKSTLGRVQPAQLLSKNVRYDSQKYLDLLFSSAANILEPFGCSAADLHNSLFKEENWNPYRSVSLPKIDGF